MAYGHLDKQPPLESGWADGLSPYTPVVRDGLLYGRGGADDGYSFFSSIIILKQLQQDQSDHPSITLLFETDEESGSKDIVWYLDNHKDLFAKPDLVLCLDSGALDYKRVYLTTSLRGSIKLTIKTQVLTEGVHSGNGSGYVADSFRVLTEALSHLEDPKTGRMSESLNVNIPSDKYEAAQKVF